MSDDLDELSKKLFAAGRAERATEETRNRTLNASSRTLNAGRSSRAATIIGTTALAAGVAGLLWFGEQRIDTPTIDREMVTATRPAKPATEPDEARRPDIERPTAAAPQKLAASARSAPSVERPLPNLSEELALLESARSALAAGSSGRALELLDQYELTLRGTRLRAEASILRIEALARSGRNSDAERLAREFVKNYAGSPLVDRARSFTGSEQNGPDHRDQDPGRTP